MPYMKINLFGNIESIIDGFQLLCKDLNVQLYDSGYPIEVIQREGPIEVINKNGQGKILFQDKVHFYRAIGLWLEHYHKTGDFELKETPHFKTCGSMFDVSRNAVLKVEEIKQLLRKMALMGLNMFMVYTEDTYEMKDYPYFGYMRGRYTEEELAECDRYASLLGIEMIPCIQTLAHLTAALKWGYASEIKDTHDILLVGEPKTYEFIEAMITAASKPFQSKRIHIGMDEAHQLGLGRYLEKNGYENRFDIMNKHLQQVIEITEKHGLEPMIWSDMYFRLGSKVGSYYDPDVNIPKEAIASIPENVQLVYWDYYHSDEAFYRTWIEKHKELGSEPIFAGGAWTWNGISPNYGKAFQTSEAALSACKKEGISEVFTTIWGDNGAETPMTTALPILQYFAEHCYQETFTKEQLAERFQFCTGYEIDDFLLLNQFDETPGVMKDNPHGSNASKFLLWQDVLIGLFDENIRGHELNNHYSKLIPKLEEVASRNKENQPLFSFYAQLADVLSVKAEIGLQIKDSYDKKDTEKTRILLKQIEQLRESVKELRIRHRTLWFSLYKPFGWEVLEIRYGGLEARLETAHFRIEQWINGEISRIGELEEERLPYDGPYPVPEGSLGSYNIYQRIATASVL